MPSLSESARRYAALARAVLRARRRPFDPFKLTWILTERCSLHCRTCHLWATDPQAGPDRETVLRVLRANAHLTWMNLSGGDLVERHDAPELLADVVAECPDLALLDFPTAGQDTRATLAALQPALDSDVPRIVVSVSLDGPDSVHDRLRGRPGAAAAARTTYRRLKRVRRRGFQVVAGLTLSRWNLPARGSVDPAALWPEQIDPHDLHVNLAHGSAHYYRTSNDVAAPTEAALAVLDDLAARRRPTSLLALLERRYWTLARRYLSSGDVGGHCGALRASVYLGADLRVYPCTIWDRPLGNLADVGYALRRIPELRSASQALTDLQARRCPGCWSPCEAFPTLLLGLGRPL